MNLYRRVSVLGSDWEAVVEVGSDYVWLGEYYTSLGLSKGEVRSKTGVYVMTGEFEIRFLKKLIYREYKHFTHRFLGEWCERFDDDSVVVISVLRMDHLVPMNDDKIDVKRNLDKLDTMDGVREVANLIAMKYWGVPLDIEVSLNSRLESSYGRLKYARLRNKKNEIVERVPTKLEISEDSLKSLTKWSMLDLIKHEVCHWACLKMDRPSSDGAKFFESELDRINSTSSGTVLLSRKS